MVLAVETALRVDHEGLALPFPLRHRSQKGPEARSRRSRRIGRKGVAEDARHDELERLLPQRARQHVRRGPTPREPRRPARGRVAGEHGTPRGVVRRGSDQAGDERATQRRGLGRRGGERVDDAQLLVGAHGDPPRVAPVSEVEVGGYAATGPDRPGTFPALTPSARRSSMAHLAREPPV